MSQELLPGYLTKQTPVLGRKSKGYARLSYIIIILNYKYLAKYCNRADSDLGQITDHYENKMPLIG